MLTKIYIYCKSPGLKSFYKKIGSHDQNLQNQKVVSDSFPWIWYTEPKTGFRKFLKSPGKQWNNTIRNSTFVHITPYSRVAPQEWFFTVNGKLKLKTIATVYLKK